jgi:subtilisin family serine protease
MATPMVAAAAALLLQQRRQSQQPVTPAAIRQALLSGAVSPVTLPTNVAGSGRLDLAQYGVIVPTT